MDKPDPYGDWVLFGTKEGPAGSALGIDEELSAAAREAWPHVLAHVRGELFDKVLGAERRALAADIWDQVLRDDDAKALAKSFGAHVLLDKMNLYSELIPAIKQYCPSVSIPKIDSFRKASKRPAGPSIAETLDAA
jgi:hypothetical protein